MESILESIKKMLGFTSEQKTFDMDILIHINSAFARLNSLGVGPEEGYSIQDEYPIWDDYLKEDKRLNNVKLYVYQKVKLNFDPPLSAAAIKALENSIAELEYLINTAVETSTNS